MLRPIPIRDFDTAIGCYRTPKVTDFAMPPTCLSDVEIFSSERMAALTVRFPCIDRCVSNASQPVFSRGNGFEMFWVNAIPDTAEMVKLQSLYDWAARNLISESMRVHLLIADCKSAVPSPSNQASPKPALAELFVRIWNRAMFVHLFPKARLRMLARHGWAAFAHSGKTLYHSLAVCNPRSRRWNRRESFAVSTPLGPAGMFLANLLGWAVPAP
jgi:hypothetical protein